MTRLPTEKIISYIGNGAPKLVERSMADCKISQEECLSTFLDLYEKNICIQTDFYPGIQEFLKELQSQKIVATVLTNKPQNMTDKLLKKLDATKYFQLIYGPEAYGRKPEPNGLLETLKQLNIQTQDAFMVGDHTTDLDAAKNAGVKSIFCHFGLGTKEGCSHDYEITTGDELFKFL